MGRWKEFMERGPDRLPTDESDEYNPDSADEIIVPLEVDDEDIQELFEKGHNAQLDKKKNKIDKETISFNGF